MAEDLQAKRGEPEIVLDIRDLVLEFETYAGDVKALDRVNLLVRRGETLGLVGESGCGKSVTAMTVMRLVASPPGKYSGGRVLFAVPIEVKPLPGAPRDAPTLPAKGTVKDALADALLARYQLYAEAPPSLLDFARTEHDEKASVRTGSATNQERRTALIVASAALRAAGAKDADEFGERKVDSLGAEDRATAERALAWAMTPRERYAIDLLKLTEVEMQRIRGNDISMIFQEPMTSLNPVLKVGEQISEAVLRHQSLGVKTTAVDKMLASRRIYTRRMRERRRKARQIAGEMLKTIGIPDPVAMLDRYPHELSGGMRQRVMIAMALATNPSLLIADEPTTALDVTIQAQIMELMKDLKKRMGASILLITHHLGIVAEMCDRVSVMYAGHVIETATTHEIFHAPKHPYTLALLRSIPDARGEDRTDLPTISGSVPNLIDPPKGCRFHPRCPYAFAKCSEERPPPFAVDANHEVMCHLWSTPVVEIPQEFRRAIQARHLPERPEEAVASTGPREGRR